MGLVHRERAGTGRRPRPLLVAGALAVVVALGALALVTSARGSDEAVAVLDEPSPASGAPAPPAETRGQPVSLAFGGDVHFEKGLRTALLADPARPLAGVAAVLRAADVAMVNLETAVTERGTPAAGKQYTFRAPAKAFAALSSAGVDVATMANNHGMDYGKVGLEDSLAAAEAARFPVVGVGRDAAEAYRPHLVTVKGRRLALFGATDVLDDSLIGAWTATDTQAGMASSKPGRPRERLLAAIAAARSSVDTVVVFLHWGTEGQTCPNDTQPVLARALVDAGADVVVGSHSHRLQGAGRLGGAFVAYGLGNFAFYASGGPGAETGVLQVSVDGRRVQGASWVPARITGHLPRTLTGTEAARAASTWRALRPCTGLEPFDPIPSAGTTADAPDTSSGP